MKSKSPIPEHLQDVFNALTSGKFENFALLQCKVNGEDSAAIVTVNETEGMYTLTPHFVAVTPGMTILDPDGRPAEDQDQEEEHK